MRRTCTADCPFEASRKRIDAARPQRATRRRRPHHREACDRTQFRESSRAATCASDREACCRRGRAKSLSAFAGGPFQALNSRERTNQISACRRNGRDPVGAPGAAGQATLSLRLLGHRFARKGGHTRPHLAHRRLRNPRGERCDLRSGVRGDEKADLDRLPSARDRDGTCRARRPFSAHILRRSLPPRTRRVRVTAIAHRPACVRTSHLAPRALRRGARPTRLTPALRYTSVTVPAFPCWRPRARCG